jgi:hypothetical protein
MAHIAGFDPAQHDGPSRHDGRPAEYGPAEVELSHLAANFMETDVVVGGLHLRMYWHDVEEPHDEPRHSGEEQGPDGNAGRPHPPPDVYERHELRDLLAMVKAAIAAGGCGHPASAAAGADEGPRVAPAEAHGEALGGLIPGASPAEGRSVELAGQFFVAANDAPLEVARGQAPTDVSSADVAAETGPAPTLALRVPAEVLGFVGPLAAALPLHADIAVNVGALKDRIDDLVARVPGLDDAGGSNTSWRRAALGVLALSAGAVGNAFRRSTGARRRGTAAAPSDLDIRFTDEP